LREEFAVGGAPASFSYSSVSTGNRGSQSQHGALSAVTSPAGTSREQLWERVTHSRRRETVSTPTPASDVDSQLSIFTSENNAGTNTHLRQHQLINISLNFLGKRDLWYEHGDFFLFFSHPKL